MESNYKVIKYYGYADLCVGSQLEEAEKYLNSIGDSNKSVSINDIIEMYNVQLLIDCGTTLKSWSAEKHSELKEKCKCLNPIIAKSIKSISDENFIEISNAVYLNYLDDFFALIDKYGAYNNISPACFDSFIRESNITLSTILTQKDIVKHFDETITQFINDNYYSAEFIISFFCELKTKEKKYYLPNSLSSEMISSIVEKYVADKEANVNYLELVYTAKNTDRFSISDKTRLAAKNAIKEFWSDNKKHSMDIEYGVYVAFGEIDSAVEISQEKLGPKYIYNSKLLESHMSYEDILYIFRRLFRYVDNEGRITCTSIASKMTPLETSLGVKGKDQYLFGLDFNLKQLKAFSHMDAYVSFLKDHNIYLEQFFSWFFNDYIIGKYNVTGFAINPPEIKSGYVEKCRALASEMEGVLKQFRMLAEDGVIDRELFELSSEHMIFDRIKSLIGNKYLYVNDQKMNVLLYLLFSNQSMLGFTERTKEKYTTFFELISSEKVLTSDYKDFFKERLSPLIEENIIFIENDVIVPDFKKILLLQDLYDNDVICFNYLGKEDKKYVEYLVSNGMLRFESTLFSLPEIHYFNYMLNKSEYSNGKDLRNKYSHSTYPLETTEQQLDYIEILRLMVLVILKIEEEFQLQIMKE